MDKQRRKELKDQFNQIKIYMGVYEIKNNVNQKIFIGTATNLKNKWLTLQWQLHDGHHANACLQKDWQQYGSQAFSYAILEEKDTTDISDRKYELKQMKRKWMDKLQPYYDQGYHNPDTEIL